MSDERALAKLVRFMARSSPSQTMTFVVPPWEKSALYDCGDRCRITLYLGWRLYFCSALHPNYKAMVNLLLLILLIVTKSCVLYILMHILSSRLLWVQQCEFEEYLNDDIAPNYQGPGTESSLRTSTMCGTRSIGGWCISILTPSSNWRNWK
jgi:hypothetical protein